MTPAEVLRRAAVVLDERGWVQGSLELETGECCAIGAVRSAQPNWTTGDSAMTLLNAVIPVGYLCVAEWNDAEGRTVDEVKAALLAAAEKCAS